MKKDHEVSIRDARDSREEDLQRYFDRIDECEDEGQWGDIDKAQEQLDIYALESSFTTTFEITLSIGGPTEWLSARVDQDDKGDWERIGGITYHHSWGVNLNDEPMTEIPVWGDGALGRYFDSQLEAMS